MYILGLSETCSNIASRPEPGGSTMEIDIQMHIVKYRQRISVTYQTLFTLNKSS